MRVHELQVRRNYAQLNVCRLFVRLRVCLCEVVMCPQYMASPYSGEKPTRYEATVLCKSVRCTKGPLHARLFRSIKYAVGLPCDRFARGFLSLVWLMGTRFCVDLWVSCFWCQSFCGVKSTKMNGQHMRWVIAGHFITNLNCFVSQRVGFVSRLILTLQLKLSLSHSVDNNT